MRRRFRSAAGAAMSVAVAGGVLLATALPAGAEGGDNAFAVQDVNGYYGLGPLGRVTDYSWPYVSSGISLPGLLSTGMIVDRATPTLASAQLGSVVLHLNSRVTIRLAGLSGWCRVSPGNDVYGGATLGSGSVLQIGGTTIPLPVNPAPDTIITFAGGGEIDLNAQTSDPGDIQVFGAEIFPGNGEQIQLAQAYCDSFR